MIESDVAGPPLLSGSKELAVVAKKQSVQDKESSLGNDQEKMQTWWR